MGSSGKKKTTMAKLMREPSSASAGWTKQAAQGRAQGGGGRRARR